VQQGGLAAERVADQQHGPAGEAVALRVEDGADVGGQLREPVP